MKDIINQLQFRRELLIGMVLREVSGRYRGSNFGMIWSLLSPLLMLMIYTFAFHELLGARWPGVSGRDGFAVMVFVGMILHSMFAEVLTRAPASISGQPNFVKKLVFPLTILPLVSIGSSLIHAALAFCVLAGAGFAVGYQMHWTALLIPVIIVPYLLLLSGVAWAFAAIGVYIKDISQLSGLLATMLLFLSPVFYPMSSVPEPYDTISNLNPLTFVIESIRGMLFDGRLPEVSALLSNYAVSIVSSVLGLAFFRQTRPGFGDVL